MFYWSLEHSPLLLLTLSFIHVYKQYYQFSSQLIRYISTYLYNLLFYVLLPPINIFHLFTFIILKNISYKNCMLLLSDYSVWSRSIFCRLSQILLKLKKFEKHITVFCNYSSLKFFNYVYQQAWKNQCSL